MRGLCASRTPRTEHRAAARAPTTTVGVASPTRCRCIAGIKINSQNQEHAELGNLDIPTNSRVGMPAWNVEKRMG